MLKREIKSEIVDVQKEFEKSGGYTIESAFAFNEILIWVLFKLGKGSMHVSLERI